MKATVFEIQRFSINDGPGIRTTVFMKGCPLKCPWCHNPESKSALPQLRYAADKCLMCGACLSVCENGGHLFGEKHTLARKACKVCGKCADICPANALELAGEEKEISEIVATVLRDKPFYETSGGGVTFSGGEPLFQYDALVELAKACKAEGLHTAMESSGYIQNTDKLVALTQWIDLFLFDCKSTDAQLHKKLTGVDMELIHKNLRALNDAGARIILRCPLIPGFNATEAHLQGIAELANSLLRVEMVEIEPYHPLGKDKAAAFGLDYPPGDMSFVPDEVSQGWLDTLEKLLKVPVRKA